MLNHDHRNVNSDVMRALLSVLVLALIVVLRVQAADAPVKSNYSLPRESGLPGNELMEAVEKYNTIGCDGDLTVTIPLYTVPGDISVPLNLSYRSGIKLDQSATWVGLGWSMGNWSVRRSAIHGADVQSFDYYCGGLWDEVDPDYQPQESRVFINDVYEVTIPGRTVKFLNVGTQGDPKFEPLSPTRDSLYVQRAMELYFNPDPYEPDIYAPDTVKPPFIHLYPCWTGTTFNWSDWCYYERWKYVPYEYFIMVDENGTEYSFGKALKGTAIGEPRQDEMWENIGEYESDMLDSRCRMENREWLLTSIKLHDQNLAQVHFYYTETDTLLNGAWTCADQPTYDLANHQDSTEIAYLETIEGYGVRVEFTLDSLNAFRTIRYYRSGYNYDTRHKDLVLAQMTVYDNFTDEVVHQVTFNYEEDGQVPLKTGWHQYFIAENGCELQNRDGEPTLRSVVIGTDNIFARSDDKEAFDGGCKKKYSFTYDIELDEGDGYLFQNGNQVLFNSYTNWIYGKDRDLAPVVTDDFWDNNDLANQAWVEDTAQLVHYAWGDRDFFGYHFKHPQAWSLTGLTTSEGLSYEYAYEPDEFMLHGHRWVSGGCRVKNIMVNASLSDNQFYETISLWYGVNVDSIGYPNSMPGNFHSYWNLYNLWNLCGYICVPFRPTEFTRFAPDNIPHHIQYPVVKWSLGDRGSIERYYTTSNTHGEDTRLEMIYGFYNSEWLGCDFFLRYSYFIDRSPMLGVLYKTVAKDQSGNVKYSEEKYFSELGIPCSNTFFDDSFVDASLLNSTRFYDVSDPDSNFVTYSNRGYAFMLDSVTVIKDGVMSRTAYGYENTFYRPIWIHTENNEYTETRGISWIDCPTLGFTNNLENPTSTPFGTDGPDCYVLPNEYRCSRYLNFPNCEKTWRNTGSGHVLMAVRKYEYTRQTDFPSAPFWGSDEVYYLSKITEWNDLDGDQLVNTGGSENLVTYEVLDKSPYGRDMAVRQPDGTTDMLYQGYVGTVGSVENVEGGDFGFMNAEADFREMAYDIDGELGADGVIDNTTSFTGEACYKVVSDGSRKFWGPFLTSPEAIPEGLYMAELWGKCDVAHKLRIKMATFDATTGELLTSVPSVYVDAVDEWTKVVCSLYVGPNERLTVYTAVDGDGASSAYIDDFRLHPAKALMTTQTLDGLHRPTTQSGYNNVPVRNYYGQYGDVLAIADHRFSPLSGSEQFFKTTDYVYSAGAGQYLRDMPNAVHSFQNRGRGLVEDFRNQPYIGSGGWQVNQYGGSLDWDDDLQYTTTSAGNYVSIKIPVDGFTDGFMVFDFNDSSQTGCPDPPPHASIMHRTNLWFGFENATQQSLGIAMATVDEWRGKFYIFRDDQLIWTDPATILVEDSFYGEWVAPNCEGKRRLMIGKMGSELYLFINGECVYHHHLTNDDFGEFCYLKIHLKHPETGVVCQEKIWVDDLVFHSDPVVISEFVDAFGITKQAQSFDGDKIIVSGATHTPDMKPQVTFKPISTDLSYDYGDFAGINPHANPFDFIDAYLVSSTMWSWEPGDPIDQSSLLYGYYTDPSTPNCEDDLGNFVPYTEHVYDDDPLRRIKELRPPALFRDHPVRSYYGKTSAPITGFDATLYGEDKVRKEKLVNENGNIAISYKDKRNWTIATVQDSTYDGLNVYTRFYKDFNGLDTLIVQPEGHQIRREYNNLGLLMYDSSGDYGVTQYQFDKAANIRFVMTASDQAGGRFHYYKYDGHGRVVQEGVLDDTLQMTWANACDPDFPLDGFENNGALVTSINGYDGGQWGAGLLTKSISFPWGAEMLIDTTVDEIITVDTIPDGDTTYTIYGEYSEVLAPTANVSPDDWYVSGTASKVDAVDHVDDGKYIYGGYIGHVAQRYTLSDPVDIDDQDIIDSVGISARLMHDEPDIPIWLRLFVDGTGTLVEEWWPGVPGTEDWIDVWKTVDGSAWGYADIVAMQVQLSSDGSTGETGYCSFLEVTVFYRDADMIVQDHYDTTTTSVTTIDTTFNVPDGHDPSWETFTYDEYGRPTGGQQFVAGTDISPRAFGAEYNQAGQITRVAYNNGKYVDYMYDRGGRVDEVIDDDGIMAFSYDYWPDGSYKTKTISNPALQELVQQIDYKYNARGWLTSINDGTVVSPSGGSGDHFAVELTYDYGGYLACGPECGGVCPEGYYNGNIASYALRTSNAPDPDTLTMELAYDRLDRLAGIHYTSDVIDLSSQHSVYDKNGNIQQLHYVGDIRVDEYSYYPGTNRVWQFMSTDGEYAYTPSGSIANNYVLDINMNYDFNERLSRSWRRGGADPADDTSGVVYRYNSAGQRIRKTAKSFSLFECDHKEPANPPIDSAPEDPNDPNHDIELAASSEDPKQHRQSFEERYPLIADGKPITWCTLTTQTHTAYYYFANNVLSEYSGDEEADLLNNYVYVGGKRVASFKGSDPDDVRYHLSDHLGSVVATVDNYGELKNMNQYKPFGELDHSYKADDQHYMYTGKERDFELAYDLDYFGARYYDSKLRRFLSVDPLAAKYPGLSPYVYCANNPLMFVDPDGEGIFLIFAAVVAIVMAFDEIANTPTSETDVYDKSAGDYFIDCLEAFTYLSSSTRMANFASKTLKNVSSKASGTSSTAGETGTATSSTKSRPGSKGHPDHQAKVAEVRDAAKTEAKPGEKVRRETKVQGHQSQRIPDVQILDKNGVTRKVFEIERRPNSRYHVERIEHYNNLGIENVTIPIETVQ